MLNLQPSCDRGESNANDSVLVQPHDAVDSRYLRKVFKLRA